MESLAASSNPVNIRSLVEEEQNKDVESIGSETENQYLFTPIKDETDHIPNQFLSTLSTHSDKPSDGTIGQNAERGSVDQTNDGQGTPTEVFETPEMKEMNPRLVQEKETELKARSKPSESNSAESHETKDREKRSIHYYSLVI